LGTRLALGAGFGRLAADIATESLTLAGLGGAAGLSLAFVLVSSLDSLGLTQFPRSGEISLRWTTMLFAVCASLFAGCVIALFSIVRLRRLSVASALRDSGRAMTQGRGAVMSRQALAAAQVAMTFVLLTGAALMLASFRELSRVEPGYRLDGVLTASTAAPASLYPADAALDGLTTRLLDRVRQAPGVKAAGATSAAPLASEYNSGVIFPEGYQVSSGEPAVSPLYASVTPGYFDAMGISMIEGRAFDPRDRADSLPAIIVDEGLAQRFWPGANPVGRRMYLPSAAGLSPDENTEWLTVVGVASRVRMKNLAGTDNAAGMYYRPFAQQPARTLTFVVQSASPTATLAPELRAVFAEAAPGLALFDLRTMAERASASLSARRAALTLLLSFGAISLFLAALGLFGVLSYMLARRRREVGIRKAVGCTSAGVFWLFLREGAVLVGAGVTAGLAITVLAQDLLQGLLYGVRPFEPLLLGTVTLLLAVAALLAVAGPAATAARIDPGVALKQD
ncbi:MAG: ABC transporter permease, partial [Acidobacteria bacterium]|nr:ABC transporter permease [Acidobacteriota bacterium]